MGTLAMTLSTGPAAAISMVEWPVDHWWWLVAAGLVLCLASAAISRWLADRASTNRVAVELAASRRFDPGGEEILRFGMQLCQAANAGSWWAPWRARTARIRMRTDGSAALSYRVEAPAAAAHLLTSTPYSRLRVHQPSAIRPEAERRFVVRAQFTLKGRPGARLRDVPLDPDPLQPLVDAVADLRADLGDLVEVCVDLQPAPRLQLAVRRWQAAEVAREEERREARRAARWMRWDADDSFRQVLSFGGGDRPGRRMLMPTPRRVSRERALGKLVEGTHLIRVQVMVRCASNVEDRARQRMQRLQAALEVFAAEARWVPMGHRWGPVHLGPDQWPWRARFDQLWSSGKMRPPRTNLVQVPELAGLLKPPTVHCRLPLPASAMPSFVVGDPSLLLQGWYRDASGRRRLVATREEQTKFETAIGKAGGGKTERALCQAVGLAHAGHGLMFLDPHGDSWAKAARYLAHDEITQRLARINLAAGYQDVVGCWNPLGMDRRQAAHEVVTTTVDGLASALRWNDASAPRALTILAKGVEALVAVNASACRAGAADCQATLFHLRPLLTDPAFREPVLEHLERVDGELVRWWRTSFPAFPPEGMTTVLNPLDRLAANPVSHAMLGSPVGAYDIRAAMDHRMVVWICLGGTGPTDRLLVSLLVRDLLRAGLSRRDTDERGRVPFRVYLDELISLSDVAASSIAEILEQLRKYAVRVHGMTQLLQRLPGDVRTSLLQNSSSLTTTTGSMEAIAHINREWGGQVEPGEVAELPLYQHFGSFTVDGNRVGPLQILGPTLEEVFEDLARPQQVAAVNAAADARADARTVEELVLIARTQHQHVLDFLARNRAGEVAAPDRLPALSKEPR